MVQAERELKASRTWVLVIASKSARIWTRDPPCLLLEGYFLRFQLFSLRAFSIPEYHHCGLAHSFSASVASAAPADPSQTPPPRSPFIASCFLRWSFSWHMRINWMLRHSRRALGLRWRF